MGLLITLYFQCVTQMALQVRYLALNPHTRTYLSLSKMCKPFNSCYGLRLG